MIPRVSLALAVLIGGAPLAAAPRQRLAVEPMPTITPHLDRWTRVRIERCRRSDPRGCREAAYAFRVGGSSVVADPMTARRLYTRAWSLRARRTEQDLLPLYEMGVASAEERTYLQGVCERGGGCACAVVGLHDLHGARSRRAQHAALDLVTRGASCPQVGYDYFSYETGRDLRREHPWYFHPR